MSASSIGVSTVERGPVSLKRIREGWRAYSYRVPYCVPYWNAATYRAILRCLATGRVVHGPEIDEMEARLTNFFSVPIVRGYSKGRVAVELALRMLGVGRGDEVILPTFCCTSVVPPVLATGALPVLADVGPELNLTPESVEKTLTSHTRAIIVPHLFGNPADIEAIESLARSKGKAIKIIDDAAQAFGATFNGRLAGTFGDAGIVSFGSGKVCFGTGGGVLISKVEGWLDKSELVGPSRGNVPREISDTLSIVLWRRWRHRLLPVLIAGRYLRKVRRKNPSSTPEPYAKELISNLRAAVILTLLDTLAENLAARRDRVCVYRKLLEKNNSLALVPHREGSACVTQVVQIKPGAKNGDRADIIVSRLRSAGYEIKGSYIPLHVVPEYSHFARKTPHFADRVWPHLIELPCEPDVSITEVERIASIVQQS